MASDISKLPLSSNRILHEKRTLELEIPLLNYKISIINETFFDLYNDFVRYNLIKEVKELIALLNSN